LGHTVDTNLVALVINNDDAATKAPWQSRITAPAAPACFSMENAASTLSFKLFVGGFIQVFLSTDLEGTDARATLSVIALI
jgi:hypothetical protein